jgi:hypothetical protein
MRRNTIGEALAEGRVVHRHHVLRRSHDLVRRLDAHRRDGGRAFLRAEDFAAGRATLTLTVTRTDGGTG